jgi:hypothetical protein
MVQVKGIRLFFRDDAPPHQRSGLAFLVFAQGQTVMRQIATW